MLEGDQKGQGVAGKFMEIMLCSCEASLSPKETNLHLIAV